MLPGKTCEVYKNYQSFGWKLVKGVYQVMSLQTVGLMVRVFAVVFIWDQITMQEFGVPNLNYLRNAAS